MTSFVECWLAVAPQLLNAAYPSGAQLDALPSFDAGVGWVCYATEVEGACRGRLIAALDKDGYESGAPDADNPLALAWPQLLEEIAQAACKELQRRGGAECRAGATTGLQTCDVSGASGLRLSIGDASFVVLLLDEVNTVSSRPQEVPESHPESRPSPAERDSAPTRNELPVSTMSPGHSPNMDLLLDVELEASLRFGSREMPLSEILELGPGDVVQLDRHVADPVDLIVGDKIVARGEVVLVNGNFGLRVTEVAEPRRRLESIRCLF